MNNTLSLDASFPPSFYSLLFYYSICFFPSLHHNTPLFKSSEMSAIFSIECYSRRGAYAPPLTPSVKGGGSVAPYIPHLFICINLLLLQAAIAHVAQREPTGSPLTPPFSYGQGDRGDKFESHQSRCKFSVQLNRHGAEVDFKALEKL